MVYEKYKDAELRAKLDPMPRKLGLGNQVRFLACGPGSIAWLLCFLCILWAYGLQLAETMADWTYFKGAPRTKATTTLFSNDVFFDNQLAVFYSYEVDGVTYGEVQFSYTNYPPKKAGDLVDIEYVADDPALSRIVGGSYSKYRWVSLLPLGLAAIFGLVGVYGWRKSLRWGRVLQQGLVAEAVLDEAKEHRGEEGEVAYDLSYTFKDAGGGLHSLRRHGVSSKKSDELVDEERELVLYDPENPDLCFLADELPFDTGISQPGRWDSPSGGAEAMIWIRATVMLVLFVWVLARLGK